MRRFLAPRTYDVGPAVTRHRAMIEHLLAVLALTGGILAAAIAERSPKVA